MTETRRDEALLRALARLADTLVADYDIVDLLQTLVEDCRDLLHVTASGCYWLTAGASSNFWRRRAKRVGWSN